MQGPIHSISILDIAKVLTPGLILQDKEIEEFKQILKPIQFKKNHRVTSPGERAEFFYLIERGVMRNYFIDSDGKTHTKGFHGPQGLIGPYAEFLSQQKTRYHIECVTHCETFQFSINEFLKIAKGSMGWMEVQKLLAEASYRDKEDREIVMLSKDVLKRYEYCKKRFSPYFEQIPKHMIASYIGSTPEGLSKALKKGQLQ